MKTNYKSASILIVFALMCLSNISSAGVKEGGGGNAVVCFDDSSIPARIRAEKLNGGGYVGDLDISHITGVEILDLFEARASLGGIGSAPVSKKLIEAKAGESADLYIARLLRRFDGLIPTIREMIEKGKVALSVYKQFPRGLDPIDDVGPGENINTDKCVRVTIIAQYERDGGFIGYDPRIFNLPDSIFSATSKGLSLLHEHLYWNARQLGATKSDSSRDLIGAMIDEDSTVLTVIRRLSELAPNQKVFPGSGTFAQSFSRSVWSDLTTSGWLNKEFREPIKSFQNYDSVKAQCLKNATDQLLKPALQRYVQVSRPQLFAMKNVPQLVLEHVDSVFQNMSLSLSEDVSGNRACVATLARPATWNILEGPFTEADYNFLLPKAE